MFILRTTLIVVPLALLLVAWTRTPQSTTESLAAVTATSDRLPATAVESGPTESLPPEKVAEEIDSLVQELRDLPGDLPARACTPCNTVSKVIGAKRRRDILDELNALGSAAVPELARMLQNSLHGSDKDLTSTVLWILSSVSGPYTDRDGKQHEGSDISAALPTQIKMTGGKLVRWRN